MKGFVHTVKKASPTILTCLGAVGVIATAVAAVKATPKAIDLCRDISDENEKEPSMLDYIKAGWKYYIPSAAIGLVTIGCIFGANGLNKRKLAAITGTYILLDQAYREYKNKVKEIFGEEGNRQILNAVFRDRTEDVDISPTDENTLLFYEEHYGKFFERTMLEVQDAEYRINQKLAKEGEASLNDFLRYLSLPELEIGDDLGWVQEMKCDTCRPLWIDFEHYLVTMDDGMECYIINMVLEPTDDYRIPF